MAEEIDVGRLVAEIVLENKTEGAAEEVKDTLKEIAQTAQKEKPKVDVTVDPTTAVNEAKKAVEVVNTVVVSTHPVLSVGTDAQALDFLRQELERLGADAQLTEQIISCLFTNLEPIKQYQKQLDILADKIDNQKNLIEELNITSQKMVNGSKSGAKVEKATKALEPAKTKLKELELQYDNVSAAQEKYIEKTLTDYVNAEKKQAQETEKAAKKQEELNQKLSQKTSITDMALGFGMLSSSMKTANRISPGLIDNIRTIMFQITLAKKAIISASSTPMAWATGIVAAVGLVVAIVSNVVYEIQEKEEKARASASKLADTYKTNNEDIQDLMDSYTELATKLDITNLSHSEEISTKTELISLQKKLAESYGDESDGIDLVNGKLDEQIGKVNELTDKKAEQYIAENADAYSKAQKGLSETKSFNILYGVDNSVSNKSYKSIKDFIEKEFNGYAEKVADAGTADKTTLKIDISTKDAKTKLTDLSGRLEKLKTDGLITQTELDNVQRQISRAMGTIDDDVVSSWEKIVKTYEDAQKRLNSPNDGEAYDFEMLQEQYSAVTSTASAVDDLSSAYKTLSSGETLSADKLAELSDMYPQISQYIQDTGDMTLKDGDIAKTVAKEKVQANIDVLNSEKETLEKRQNRTDEENNQLRKINATISIYKSNLEGLNNTNVKLDLSEAKAQLDTLGNAFSTLQDSKRLDLSTTLDLIQAYPEFAQSLASGNTSIADQEKCVKALFDAKKQVMILSLQADEQETQSLVNSTQQKANLINQQIEAYAALGGGFGNIYGEKSEEQQSLNEYQDKLSQIKAQIKAINGLSAEDYSKNKSTSKTNEALQEQYKLIEHKKALNELTYREEISWLQMLLDKYDQTAEERMTLQEKIYTAQQNLQKEQEQAVKDQAQAYSDMYNDQLSQIEHLTNIDQLNNTQQLAWLQTLYSQYVLTGEERIALEEKIYNLEKSIQEEQAAAIKQQRQDELALLDHRKNMGLLNTSNELSWLQRIKDQYEMDASERYTMEERIYNLKKQQAEELAEQQKKIAEEQKKYYQDRITAIKNANTYGATTYEEQLKQLYALRTGLRHVSEEWRAITDEIRSIKSAMNSERSSQWESIGNGVVEALKNQYQEQKDLEEQRLNDSIDSWKSWEDETVAAIEAQIKALDDLADAQESEEKRQEYENKRQATELQLAYEKDDYNRAELQKELNRLDKAEADRLAEEQRKAQKEQLQQQIDDAKDFATQKQDALKAELDTLDKNYEKLMSNMSLQSEAYQYIVTHSQSQIIELIGSYAPEYEGLGKTFGEKLYDGMKSAIGNMDWWMKNANILIGWYQSQTERAANIAADEFWATRAQYEATILNNSSAPAVKDVSVNMTVNFNDKVDNPSDVTKRMESVTQNIISEIKK